MPAIDERFALDPNSGNLAQQNLQASFTAAGSAVSAASRDTAAARVRARTANQNRGAVQSIQAGGTRNVGQMRDFLQNQQQTSANALATGLADVEQNFTQSQLEAATAQGAIAANQGTLANLFNQTGIASNTQKANEQIGFQNAATAEQRVADQLRLGLGELEIGEGRLEETIRQQKQQELFDFFQEFAQSGATISENPDFNARFQELIAQLFGSQGVTLPPGAAPPGTVPPGTVPTPAPGTNEPNPISSDPNQDTTDPGDRAPGGVEPG